ncbi:MAG: SprT family zinc-dependent metalloprotease [Verrucomicrobiota bacterium]
MTRTHRDITYDLQRSDRRKTASLYIERDGGVTVIVPKSLSNEKVEELIEQKRSWIYRGIAEWRDLNASRVQREFVNGEGFLYLGSSYRLRLVEQQEEPLVLRNGYFCLRSDCTDPEAEFRQFYRRKGIPRICERVKHYEAIAGIEARGVRVMELKNRWASCSSGGNLSFHWRCLMAPRTVLDYIVAHEVTHLKHPNHTEAFWAALDRLMPDFKDRKAWLRDHGAEMTL